MMISSDVIGIDVSKHDLDVFDGANSQGGRLANDAEAIGPWVSRLEGRFVVFEATGAYDEALRRALAAAGVRYARVNPTKARSFAKAAGFLAKTDQVDARMLAAMGSALRPRPAEPTSPALPRLVRLHKRHDQLVADRKRERTRRREATDAEQLADFDRHLAFLEDEIADVETRIDGLIAAEPDLKRTAKLLVSIPGVGKRTAACLLALLPELGQRSPKTIAALAGLAPINQDSGLKRGQRSIRGGRKRVRDGLYMAALCLTRLKKTTLGNTYQHLRNLGKPAKLAQIAVARKLLTIANAVVRDQLPYAA